MQAGIKHNVFINSIYIQTKLIIWWTLDHEAAVGERSALVWIMSTKAADSKLAIRTSGQLTKNMTF